MGILFFLADLKNSGLKEEMSWSMQNLLRDGCGERWINWVVSKLSNQAGHWDGCFVAPCY